MKGFCLVVSLLVLASTPAYAITDTEIIKKYVAVGNRTPGEPKQCRGMIAAFSRWSNMAKRAQRMVDRAEENLLRSAGQPRNKAEKHLSDTRANLRGIEKNLAEIDAYTQKHCQSYEETPSVMETCVWSIPRLCDVETTDREKCAGIPEMRHSSTRLLNTLGRIAALRRLNATDREQQRKSTQTLEELDRFERENCVDSSAAAGKDVTQEIIARCRTEWPDEAVMVKHCVDQDLAALRALDTYPEEHQPIITRCLQEWSGEYKMVKHCADQNIEAEEALSRY